MNLFVRLFFDKVFFIIVKDIFLFLVFDKMNYNFLFYLCMYLNSYKVKGKDLGFFLN